MKSDRGVMGRCKRAPLVLTVSLLISSGCASKISEGIRADEGLIRNRVGGNQLGIRQLSFETFGVDLPNGMRVGCEQTETRGMMGAVLTLGVGSLDDPPGKEGLAHLIEHVVFRGRSGDADGDRALRLQKMGTAYSNASTSRDLTQYFGFVPKDRISELIALLAEILQEPLTGVSAADLALEADIVANEYRQRDETGTLGVVTSWLNASLFASDHPYHRPLMGDVSRVSTVTLADATAFARRNYVTERASIQLLGECRDGPGALEKLLPASLLQKPVEPKKPVSRTINLTSLRVPEPTSKKPQERHVPVDDPVVVIGWRLPGLYSKSGASVAVMTTPITRRVLCEQIRDLEGVKDCQFSVAPEEQATIVLATISVTDVARRESIASKASRIVSQFWEVGENTTVVVNQSPDQRAYQTVELEELIRWRQRQQATAESIFAAEDFVSRALARAAFLQSTGDGRNYSQFIQDTASVPSEQLTLQGKRYFAADRARVLFLTPSSAETRKPDGRVGIGIHDLSEIAVTAGESTLFDAAPRANPPVELQSSESYRLGNGMSVVLLRRPQFPTVSVAFLRKGGPAASSSAPAVELWRRVEANITRQLENATISFASADRRDMLLDLAQSGRDNLREILELFAVRLTVLDEVDWSNVLTDFKLGLEAMPKTDATNRRDVDAESEEQTWKKLYGDQHPLAYPTDIASRAAVSDDDIRKTMFELTTPKNVVLVIAGDLSTNNARVVVEEVFGKWKGEARDERRLNASVIPQFPVAQKPIIRNAPESRQARIEIACRLPDADAKIRTEHSVLAGAIAGWLRTRLREEAGTTYGVDGEVSVNRGGTSHLSLSFEVAPQQLPGVLRIVRGHWAGFATKGFDEGTISQVRWSLLNAENLAFRTSSESAARAAETVNLGWDLSTVVTDRKELDSITGETLRRNFAICNRSTVIQVRGNETTLHLE